MSIHTTSNSLTEQGKSAPQAQQSRGYWGYAEMSEDDIKKTAGAGCGGCGGCGGNDAPAVEEHVETPAPFSPRDDYPFTFPVQPVLS